MGMRPLSEKHPITQRFRQNLTQFNVGAAHGAVDIGAPIGSKVVAPEDGVVVFDGWAWDLPGGPNDWLARFYQIKPARGDTRSGGGILTIFRNSAGSHWVLAHANRSLFNIGDRVRKGQIIQDAGTTGSSTGPHSHIALLPPNPNYANGYFGGIDPEPYMQERYNPLTDVEERKTTAHGYMDGIDSSDFQPAEIVTRVAADFVIVKTSEGIGWEAKNWRRHLADARRLGRKVGVYHYARPQNDAAREADYFYNTVKSADSRDLFWVLDWEEPAYYANTAWASRFMARIDELTGKTAGLYANTAALNGGVWSSKDKGRPLWRAFPVLSGTGYATSFNLPAAPAGWARLVMDQYSFHGRLPGYTGDLDLNVYYGGITQWGAVGSASSKKEWSDMATEKQIEDAAYRGALRAAQRELTYKRPKLNGAGGSVSLQDEVMSLAGNFAEIRGNLRALIAAVSPSTLEPLIRSNITPGSDVDAAELAHHLAPALLRAVLNLEQNGA
ncbi:GH25 family lysozyme [Kocuria sp. CPCC 205300]|uniref:GH25 family lysozyme n=1 Tax=Kocuria sabuli TaxID=3071448 RepID=UPI0036DCD8BE